MDSGQRADANKDSAVDGSIFNSNEPRGLQQGRNGADATSPVTPASSGLGGSRRSLAREDSVQDEVVGFSGLRAAFADMKDVLQGILTHLEKNTAAVVEVGDSVSNLRLAIEMCLRVDRRTSEQFSARKSTKMGPMVQQRKKTPKGQDRRSHAQCWDPTQPSKYTPRPWSRYR